MTPRDTTRAGRIQRTGIVEKVTLAPALVAAPYVETPLDRALAAYRAVLPLDANPGPALDAEGKLAAVERVTAAAVDHAAPASPAWVLVNRAWGRMPAGTGLGFALTPGLPVDEAFVRQAARLAQFAENLRGIFAHHDADMAELARFRQMLDAELDREEMLAERRQARERSRLETIARGE